MVDDFVCFGDGGGFLIALDKMATQKNPRETRPHTGGRVVAISADTQTEDWRHSRPRIETIGGPAPVPIFKNVGDPIASGVAIAGGVVYFTTTAGGKLVAQDADSGGLLK